MQEKRGEAIDGLMVPLEDGSGMKMGLHYWHEMLAGKVSKSLCAKREVCAVACVLCRAMLLSTSKASVQQETNITFISGAQMRKMSP